MTDRKMPAQVFSYDEVTYPGHALAQAHPDRLGTMAILFGLTPPAVRTSKILEIGCGDGINLISIAQGLPEATCVGIDLALSGIKQGKEVVDYLGLKNISLRQFNIMDVEPSFGEFDYIIAHGIYSWIPDAVRDKLLAICKANLAANGVAYISYNTFPGNHIRNMVRGMMKFHVSEMVDPSEKIAQSRGLLKFLSGVGAEDPEFYRAVLAREADRVNKIPDSVLFHDDLSAVNHAVHFHEFVSHAQAHGLQYLSESQFFEMQPGVFPLEAVETIRNIADSRIAQEQYLDFMKCRSFRQTLLVHADQKIDFDIDVPRMRRFSLGAPVVTQTPASEFGPSNRVRFDGPYKSSLTTDNPVVQFAFARLGKVWPGTVGFDELLEHAWNSASDRSLVEGMSFKMAEDALGETLLKVYAAGMIEFCVHPPRLVTSPGERPIASPLARLQAASGPTVINLRHHNIRIDDAMGRGLIMLLDGSRDRATLKTDLLEMFEVPPDDKGAESPEMKKRLQASIEQDLEKSLLGLANMALLEA